MLSMQLEQLASRRGLEDFKKDGSGVIPLESQVTQYYNTQYPTSKDDDDGAAVKRAKVSLPKDAHRVLGARATFRVPELDTRNDHLQTILPGFPGWVTAKGRHALFFRVLGILKMHDGFRSALAVGENDKDKKYKFPLYADIEKIGNSWISSLRFLRLERQGTYILAELTGDAIRAIDVHRVTVPRDVNTRYISDPEMVYDENGRRILEFCVDIPFNVFMDTDNGFYPNAKEENVNYSISVEYVDFKIFENAHNDRSDRINFFFGDSPNPRMQTTLHRVDFTCGVYGESYRKQLYGSRMVIPVSNISTRSQILDLSRRDTAWQNVDYGNLGSICSLFWFSLFDLDSGKYLDTFSEFALQNFQRVVVTRSSEDLRKHIPNQCGLETEEKAPHFFYSFSFDPRLGDFSKGSCNLIRNDVAFSLKFHPFQKNKRVVLKVFTLCRNFLCQDNGQCILKFFT